MNLIFSSPENLIIKFLITKKIQIDNTQKKKSNF